MTYPCGIIRDLLPLYIDDVCNEDSKKVVENHLSECGKCSEHYESMKSTDGFAEKQNDNSEDMKMADSLKNVKLRINKKIRNIILCSVSAVVLFIIGFNVMFNAAVKEVALEDVLVSADVYSLEELAASAEFAGSDSTSVKISSDEIDESEYISITFPQFGTVSVSENTIEKNECATIVSVSSEYFLRRIERKTKDDTIYISAFKTTLFNNKAKSYQKTMTSIEFREINKIVFVDDNGKETVLWNK